MLSIWGGSRYCIAVRGLAVPDLGLQSWKVRDTAVRLREGTKSQIGILDDILPLQEYQHRRDPHCTMPE